MSTSTVSIGNRGLSPAMVAALRNVDRQAQSSGLRAPDFVAVARAIGKMDKASKPKSEPGWAKVVGAVLKPLTVPQAALFTTAHNTLAPLTGARKIDWNAAKGDYHKDAKGRSGMDIYLGDVHGMDSGLLRTATKIAADPLWLVGAVTKPVSAAGKLAQGASAASDAGAANTVRKLLSEGSNAVQRYPTRPGTIELGRGQRSITESTQAILSGIKEGRLQGPGLARMGAPRQYAEPTRFQVFRSRPKTPPTATTVSIERTGKGTYVGKSYFVAKKGDRYVVFELAEEGGKTLRGAKQLKGTHDYKDAVKLAREKALEKDWARSPYNTGGAAAAGDRAAVAQGAATATSNVEKGTFGPLLGDALQGMDRTRKFAQDKTGQRELYLRLGAGKMSKELGTGIKLGSGRAATAAGALGIGRSKLERQAHQLKVSSDELTQTALHLLDNAQAQFAKAAGLRTEDEIAGAAERLGLVAAAENAAPEAARALREDFIKAGMWNEHYDAMLAQLHSHWAAQGRELGMDVTKGAGKYAPQGPAQSHVQQWQEAWKEARKRGDLTDKGEFFAAKSSATTGRKMGSTFAYMDQAEVVRQLVKHGIPEEDAVSWARNFNAFVDDGSKIADEPGELMAELNLFTLAGRREQSQMATVLDRQIQRAAREAGIEGDLAVQKMAQQLRTAETMGPLARSTVGRNLQAFTTVFKTILTTVNPAHYVRNATGDYINHLINGNFRHLGTSAWRPRSGIWKMAQGDAEQLGRTFTLKNGEQITGAELLIESSFIGLGRGFVGSDIAQMLDLANGGLLDRGYFKWATKMNMNRENAVRLETYLKHRRAGDDMFTAGAKTLRVHFDYSDLTTFEKVFMRNIILFYTWLRRNTMLQAGGLITRPAFYNAMATMERDRPRFENEPGYVSRSMPVGLPGLGYANIGNPMSSLNQFDPSIRNLRETTLGSLNPLGSVPTSVLSNTDIGSGYQIERYPGDIRPSLIASAMAKIGVDLPTTGDSRGSDPRAGLPARLSFLLENLLPLGPQYATAGALTRERDPDSPQAGLGEILGRLSGVRPVVPDEGAARRERMRKIKEARFAQRQKKRYGVRD